MLFQLKSSLPFSLFLFVWRLESTTTKSLLRHLHCRGSLIFKSHQQKLCSKWREQHGHIHRFAVGPVYLNKSQTMCSSDFVFQKYKQDSAFCVSGVLQLNKTGPPVMKNFPFLCLFLSNLGSGSQMLCLHTLWRQPHSFAYFDRAWNVTHFDSNWPTLKLEKKFVYYVLVRSSNSKITNQRIIDFNILE